MPGPAGCSDGKVRRPSRAAAVTGIASVSFARGDVVRAVEVAEREIASRQSLDQILGVQVANIHAIAALAHLERGNAAAAEAALTSSQTALGHPAARGAEWPPAEGLGRVRQGPFHSSFPVVYLGLAAFLQLTLRQGDLAKLERYLNQLEDAVAPTPGYAADVIVGASRSGLLLARGDRAVLQRWPRPVADESLRQFSFWSDTLRISATRLSLGAGDPSTARHELEELILEIEKREANLCLAEAYVLHAAACAELHLRDRAATSTDRALALTQPVGRVGPWLDLGDRAIHLLENAVRRADASPALLSHAVVVLATLRRAESGRVTDEEGSLSDRELAVLRLLAAGHTNQQIGTALFLALGTVKKHTHNIFTKLRVSNRTQAVQAARARGLIDEVPPPAAE